MVEGAEKLPYWLVCPYATCESDGLSVVHIMVAELEVRDATEMLEITGGEMTLLIVTATAPDCAVLFDVSVAVAVKLCPPLITVVVSQTKEYTAGFGAAETPAPMLLPSNANWTPPTATLSVAFAEIVTLPDRVAPLNGTTIDTTGGVMSGVSVVAAAGADCGEVLPAAS